MRPLHLKGFIPIRSTEILQPGHQAPNNPEYTIGNFIKVYDQFKTQSDRLPETERQKIIYIFNQVEAGLGESLLDSSSMLELALSDLNTTKLRQFTDILADQNIFIARKE